MSRPTSIRGGPARPVGLLLLVLVVGLLFVGLPLAAQTIAVTSTTPNMADQGTVGLVVTITGQNFANGAKAAFYVTGTTNPGGIVVKNVKYKNAKTLEATIDVAADAQTALKFDVSVTINGRTGKGTELFKVNVKMTGGDLTPPGTVTDLAAIERSTGYNAAVLTWTAPASDGFTVASGSAAKYDLRVRKADCGPFTMDIWVDDTLTGIRSDPCHVYRGLPIPGAPGATETHPVRYLGPNRSYYAAIRTADDSPQGPNWSNLPDASQQLLFTTGPSPDTPWIAGVVDACPVTSTNCMMTSAVRLDLDGHDDPAMLYLRGSVPKLGRWAGTAWSYETTPEVDGGNWAFDLAFDPFSGEAAIASYVPSAAALKFYRRTGAGWNTETIDAGFVRSAALGFGSPLGSTGSVPTIAYRYEKRSSVQLRVARRLNSSWSIETVATSLAGGAIDHVRLAFDGDADPGVAFTQTVGSVNRTAFALRKGGAWTLEILPQETPAFVTGGPKFAYVAWDPRRGDFVIVSGYYDSASARSQVRYCERNIGLWTCGETPLLDGLQLSNQVSLAVRDDGTTYVGYVQAGTLFTLIRDPATLSWSTEYVDWNANVGPLDMHVRPAGGPVIAYRSIHDSTGAGGSDGNLSVSVARRSAQ